MPNAYPACDPWRKPAAADGLSVLVAFWDPVVDADGAWLPVPVAAAVPLAASEVVDVEPESDSAASVLVPVAAAVVAVVFLLLLLLLLPALPEPPPSRCSSCVTLLSLL